MLKNRKSYKNNTIDSREQQDLALPQIVKTLRLVAS